MPSTTLVHAIQKWRYEPMLVGARITGTTTIKIIKDTGDLR